MDKQPYILVVDDDPDILDGILAVLESQPYRLQTARDGKRCLEMIEIERPDLLILDLLMPRMDGFAVIRFLRRGGRQSPPVRAGDGHGHGRAGLYSKASPARRIDPPRQADLGAGNTKVEPYTPVRSAHLRARR
jgi:DNA-binding LytR/AlgR family response regulator